MFLFLFLLQTDDRSESNQAITFTTHRTLSNASTIAPEFKEDEEEEEEEEYFMGDPYMEEGPSFRLGSVSKVKLFSFLFRTFFFFSYFLFLFHTAYSVLFRSICVYIAFFKKQFPNFFSTEGGRYKRPKESRLFSVVPHEPVYHQAGSGGRAKDPHHGWFGGPWYVRTYTFTYQILRGKLSKFWSSAKVFTL